ncbi:MAG: hypothetical protein IE922_09135 [Sphingomonadales bacterium]|nr:hypothetical protein [Sphingomonadales bacterium]
MKTKTALAVLFLALAPSLASAMCSRDHAETASTCADGMKWDEASQSCVTPINS